MTATTRSRARKAESWTSHDFTLTAGTKGYKGAPACIDTATGKVTPAGASTTLVSIGFFRRDADATLGEVVCQVEMPKTRHMEWLPNDAANPVLAANVGGICYWLDNQTVCIVAAAHSPAGQVLAVSATDGVLVDFDVKAMPVTTSPTITTFANAAHNHADAAGGAKIAAAGVAPGTAYQLLRTNAAGTATEMGSPMLLTPAADLPAHVGNDIIPPAIVSGAVYTIPALDAGSTITLPAAAVSGTYCFIVGDGVNNDQTVQVRDATGPTNITAAIGANKRMCLLCVKLGTAWYCINGGVSP